MFFFFLPLDSSFFHQIMPVPQIFLQTAITVRVITNKCDRQHIHSDKNLLVFIKVITSINLCYRSSSQSLVLQRRPYNSETLSLSLLYQYYLFDLMSFSERRNELAANTASFKSTPITLTAITSKVTNLLHSEQNGQELQTYIH